MEKKMRVAVFGVSQIARRFAAAAAAHNNIVLQAAASRNLAKVNAFADEFEIPVCGNDFSEILAREDIDAVYIALPHKLHRPWSLAALKQGKAVLCEKPAVLQPWELDEIAAAAAENKTLFMEAMKTRFVPAYRKIKELIELGTIGDVQQVEVSLCNDFKEMLNDPTRYYNQPDQGGSLYDGGCYELNYLLDFLPEPLTDYEIEIEKAEVENGHDLYVLSRLQGKHSQAVLESSMISSKPKTARIIGSQGEIVVEDLHRPQQFALKTDGQTVVRTYPYEKDDMYSQIDAFYKTWASGRQENEIMPLQESRTQAWLLSEIRRKALIAD